MAGKQRSRGGIFILILLFIIAVAVTFTTPVLNITSVTVTGNTHTATGEILGAAGIPIGTNTYRVSMKKAEERIEALPYIREAEAKRRFPARVRIEITEREEAAAVECPGGYAIVDATGRVLRVSIEEKDGILVTGGEVLEACPGQKIVTKNERFCEDLITLLGALEKEDVGAELRYIRLSSSVDIILETKNGLEIHLGDMDELSYKLQLCRSILGGGHAGINKDSSGVLRWTSEGQFSYRQSKN